MIELPVTRSEATSYNPKLFILIGPSKAGKSTIISALDDNLVIDLEDGYRALSVMKVQARSANDIFEIRNAIVEKGRAEKKMPYKFITIDNATRLEEMALSYAAELYRATPMGAGWGMLKDAKGQLVKDPKTGKPMADPKADVRHLPNGSGYQFMRSAVKKLIDIFKPLCETLILVTHVKDKQIRRNNVELSTTTIDLAGKTGDILCGEADAIGYVCRENNKTYISFEGGDDILREARSPHLRGKKLCVIESDEDNNLKVDVSSLFIN